MRRALSAVFFLLGTVILLGMLVAVFSFLDKPAILLLAPEDAIVCAEELIEAMSRGDFKAARERIWGFSEQPESWEPPDEVSSLIWQAYLDSVECTVNTNGRTTQIGVAWDMTVSTMDIDKVTDAATEIARTLLNSQEGEKRMTSLLYEAAELAIRENSDRIVRDIRLDVVWIDGAWYALPDEQLLLVLSGRMKE